MHATEGFKPSTVKLTLNQMHPQILLEMPYGAGSLILFALPANSHNNIPNWLHRLVLHTHSASPGDTICNL